jgi:hypothetical protein
MREDLFIVLTPASTMGQLAFRSRVSDRSRLSSKSRLPRLASVVSTGVI